MAKIIDGKAIAAQVKEEAATDAAKLKEQGVTPCIAVVLIGEDPASKIYVGNKEKACELCGIKSITYKKDESFTEAQLLSLVDELNNDKSVHGILVQLPLPKHINASKALEAISPDKDVDGFHPINVGKLYSGGKGFLPCTPWGILELLARSGIEISGKQCVVIGRSNIVGKPVAALLMAQNGTVTICHSKTVHLSAICRQADIIVVATGKQNTLKGDMVQRGAVVIDVGMNRDEKGKLCGDADFDSVSAIAGAITPVPGGVGPMTIAMLMKNCVIAAEFQRLKD